MAAAVLTPSSDPWNQTLFAVPILGLYLISIVIAWMVGPVDTHGAPLRLIVTGTVGSLFYFPLGLPSARLSGTK